jgi:hypothetical protein
MYTLEGRERDGVSMFKQTTRLCLCVCVCVCFYTHHKVNMFDEVQFCFLFSNLGFPTAEASKFKLRVKIASNKNRFDT